MSAVKKKKASAVRTPGEMIGVYSAPGSKLVSVNPGATKSGPLSFDEMQDLFSRRMKAVQKKARDTGRNFSLDFVLREIEPLKPEQYKLRLGWIYYLLGDGGHGYGKFYSVDGFSLGSFHQVDLRSGISRPSQYGAIKSAKGNVFSQPYFETFQKLKELLDNLEPSLIDPFDPERKPIKFESATELQAFHMEAEQDGLRMMPGPRSPEVSLSGSKGSLIELIRDLPEKEVSNIEKLLVSFGISRREKIQMSNSQEGLIILQQLVLGDRLRRGIDTVEEYARKLMSLACPNTSIEKSLAERLEMTIAGLKMIEQCKPLPDEYVFVIGLLATHAQTLDGKEFGGLTIELLRHCCLLPENGTAK